MYVALLRGINVGGERKVEMKRLKATFEHVGMEGVRTYINSGNVIFTSTERDAGQLEETLEQAIHEDFGFAVDVLLRDAERFDTVLNALPDDWANDETAKCDVMFLWPDADEPGVVGKLAIRDGIDDVRYVSGALLWRVERPQVTKSGMMKLVGTDLYKQMTVRNCNTVRKLGALMRG